MFRSVRSLNGFSLIEVLVVIGIILVIVAITVPVYLNSKAVTKKAVCVSNMRQIYLGVQLYASDNGGIEQVPLRLSTFQPYVREKALYRCPVEDTIPADADGTYPTILGFMWNNQDVRVDWRISYFYSRDYPPAEDSAYWSRIRNTTNAGMIACIWHGTDPQPAPGALAQIVPPNLEGPIQRICFDGHLFTLKKREERGMIWSVQDTFYSPNRIVRE